MPGPDANSQVDAEHLRLGAILLELSADWDSWISRRVDSFSFTGDDERQLHRHQSVDFKVPLPIAGIELSLLDELGGFPIPLTFVRKWRLPQFSLRDEGNSSISLLQRQQSVRLGAGMLIALGSMVATEGRKRLPTEPGCSDMPEPLRRLLFSIVAGERNEALLRCAELKELGRADETSDAGELHPWRRALLASEAFMSLAYELATGFVLMAAIERSEIGRRRTVKFSYTSYVQEPGRDPVLPWIRHLGRRIVNRGSDVTDPTEWRRSSSRRHLDHRPPDPAEGGRLVLSTLCEEAPEALKPPPSAIAAAVVTIKGPLMRFGKGATPAPPRSRRRQAIRLRPTGVATIDGLPPGEYRVRFQSLSGYEIRREGEEGEKFTITAGTVTRLHARTRRRKLSRPVARAPLTMARPASIAKAIARGIGWRSKSLAIQIRSGEGGSYHCEFDAPAGLHVTRARLLSNLDGNIDGEHGDARMRDSQRPHDVDFALQSGQRAHLYAKSDDRGPATEYAMVNLRPRIETIVRPALITALGVLAVLLFLAAWNPNGCGSGGCEDETSWTLVALLLGGPGALAAYVAQTVSSRVTSSMLWGVRLLALVPTILSFAAVGVLLVGEEREIFLMIPAGLTGFACLVLIVTYYLAEHPREQGSNDFRQGRHFETHYAATAFGERPATEASHGATYTARSDDEQAAAMRDKLLERMDGLTPSTRRAALRERWFCRWEIEVPPALYFDSAESPAVFLGLSDNQMRELRGRVRMLVNNPADDATCTRTAS